MHRPCSKSRKSMGNFKHKNIWNLRKSLVKKQDYTVDQNSSPFVANCWLIIGFPRSRHLKRRKKELELTEQAPAQTIGQKAEKDSHAQKAIATLHWVLRKTGSREKRGLMSPSKHSLSARPKSLSYPPGTSCVWKRTVLCASHMALYYLIPWAAASG